MKKFEIFDIFANQFDHTSKGSVFIGILSILFGILILILPHILVMLVAAFFITLGISALIFAWQLRAYKNTYYDDVRITIDDIF